METFQFLLYPFLACILLIVIHTYFGVHILERGIIFVDLALAQFIGIGISLSFLIGEEYLLSLSLFFAFLGALILAISKKTAKQVNIEAFIGVMYIFSLAASMLILDKSPHGIEEFKTILNGNIIWVQPENLLTTFYVYAGIGIIHWVLRKKFAALTFEGRGGVGLEFLFFATFAIVLVKSVLIAGILQVFSFLVVPALTGGLFSRNPDRVMAVGWITGVAASMLGIFLSYRFDLPTAPVIVTLLALTFFTALAVKTLTGKTRTASD